MVMKKDYKIYGKHLKIKITGLFIIALISIVEIISTKRKFSSP